MNVSMKTSLAVAAAGLFIAGCSQSSTTEAAPPATADTAGVKCLGINECKGTGACNVPGGHACAGQNECKGKGWVKVGAEECTSKGGTVL
jgi:hypothetical protein